MCMHFRKLLLLKHSLLAVTREACVLIATTNRDKARRVRAILYINCILMWAIWMWGDVMNARYQIVKIRFSARQISCKTSVNAVWQK